MEKLLKLITDGEALSTEQMGKILGLTRDELDAEFQKLIDANILLGWRAVLNPDVDDSMVHAAIELRINPERDGGFDKLAQRISKFDQVDSCFLMSGAYDLAVIVESASLRGVSRFVSECISTYDTVISTATHFILKKYKVEGALMQDEEGGRLSIQP